MHGAYTGGSSVDLEKQCPQTCLLAHLPRRASLQRGFSLVELLAVITIMSILLGFAVKSIRPPVSRSNVAAVKIAHGLDMVRRFAVAKNRTVWVHFADDENEPGTLRMSSHYSSDGSLDSDSVIQFKRPQQFDDISISTDVGTFIERPNPTGTIRLNAGDWMVLRADSQVFAATGEDAPPTQSDTLAPVIEICVQATNNGRVTKSSERDVSVIHLHGPTGESSVYEP